MLPRASNLVSSRPTCQILKGAFIYLVRCPSIEHSTNYLPVRHKHVYLVSTLSVYASSKDMMITTNLMLGRGPFQELSVIGEESCELAALCVSRLQAGLVETPSGRHNMALGTWCVKQACHSWIKHGRMPSNEIGGVETTRGYDEVKIEEKLREKEGETDAPRQLNRRQV